MRTVLYGTGIACASLLLVLAVPIALAQRAGVLGTANAGRHSLENPRSFVDTTFPAHTGRTIHVAAGGDLQRAIDEGRGGDLITRDPRATDRRPFHLPAK